MAVNIPQLFTPQDCLRLSAQLPPNKAVVALCPTGSPRQTVDVMLFFRNELRKRGKTVLLLVPEKALTDLEQFIDTDALDFIYQINNIEILKHCNFINILCTYDVFLKNARNYPIDKIILFPHNMIYQVPGITSFWMDYVVMPNKKLVDFDFSLYPNSVKYFRSKSLTAIPAGYPKLDLLIDARRRLGSGLLGRVAFFPILRTWGRYVSDTLLLRELIALIDGFFQRWPDREFVLRPYIKDFNDSVFRAVERYFSSDPRFIYDTGRDNKRYLVSSDILFTDNSAVEVNFAYATLQPVIRLKFGKTSIPSPFGIGARGYWSIRRQMLWPPWKTPLPGVRNGRQILRQSAAMNFATQARPAPIWRRPRTLCWRVKRSPTGTASTKEILRMIMWRTISDHLKPPIIFGVPLPFPTCSPGPWRSTAKIKPSA